MNKNTTRALEFTRTVVFSSKWILVPFYVGLVWAQILYAWKSVQAVVHLTEHFASMDESQMMLAVLGLIDIAMIANLVRTIIAGSYHAFLDKEGPVTEHISSGYLKVKMGMSLVGVSSIHLLQAFINSAHSTDRDLIVKGAIHIVFLISTIGLAWVEYLHEKSSDLREDGHKH